MLRRQLCPTFKAVSALNGLSCPQQNAHSIRSLDQQRRAYKYQKFEMVKPVSYIFHYPREGPNTSYFGQHLLGMNLNFGFNREECWIDSDDRRYQTLWQLQRKLLIAFICMCFVFPFGVPEYYVQNAWGVHEENDFLWSRAPFDNAYIEGPGETGCQSFEWLQHIHSEYNV